MHTSLLASSQPAETASEFCKAVVLQISNHLFALPATAILKIVPSSNLESPEGRLTLWEGHPLMLLDLHQLLNAASTDRATYPKQHPGLGNHLKNFMVITRASTLDRCAIAVDELPIFQDIPLSQVQALSPYHYRLTGSIAKHRITLPHKGVPSTILLLDLQHALYRWQIMIH